MEGSGTNNSHRFSGSIKINYSIKLIPEVLSIPKSTYYQWKNKTYKNDTVTQKFIELCEANHYTYGYRKITTLINQCYTSLINHKRVQKNYAEASFELPS